MLFDHKSSQLVYSTASVWYGDQMMGDDGRGLSPSERAQKTLQPGPLKRTGLVYEHPIESALPLHVL